SLSLFSPFFSSPLRRPPRPLSFPPRRSSALLLLLVAATVPFPVLRRLARPLFLLGAAGLPGAAIALVALPGTDSTLREAAAIAASVSVLAAAMATGFRCAVVGARTETEAAAI